MSDLQTRSTFPFLSLRRRAFNFFAVTSWTPQHPPSKSPDWCKPPSPPKMLQILQPKPLLNLTSKSPHPTKPLSSLARAHLGHAGQAGGLESLLGRAVNAHMWAALVRAKAHNISLNLLFVTKSSSSIMAALDLGKSRVAKEMR